MSKLLFLSAVFALGAPAVTLAEDRGVTEAGAIVVTAARSPQRADRIGQQITVLDRAELAARQTPVLSDVLARTPGVSFSRNGGVGAVTSVYLRGAEPGHTLVLIDGVKLNDPSSTDMSFNFGHLLVGDIARLEVLRGPQSVLWGSQAIGGVVNLITADAEEAFETNLLAEGGSRAWAYGRAGVGGRSQRVNWRANAAYLTTAGISAFDAAQGGRERDGYRNAQLSGKAVVKLHDRLSVDLRSLYFRGRGEFDGFPPPSFTFADSAEYGTTENFVGYAGLDLALLDGRWRNRGGFAYTRTSRENFNPDQAVTELTFVSAGRNRRYEYQGVFDLTPAWAAVFGAETERSRMRTAAPWDPNPAPVRRSARLNGVYAQLRGEPRPGVTLSGGLRRDHHDAFGGHAVGDASVAWRLDDGRTVLRASWGEAFKAPSLYQLGSEFGNPNLRPETSESWDIGLQQRLFSRVEVSAAYFERRTMDQIDFFNCFGAGSDPLCLGPTGRPRFGYYANVARTKARGIELAAQAQIGRRLALDANYSWLDAKNDTDGSPNRGARLPRRPEHQANAEAAYRWPGALTTTVAVQYAGRRFDDPGNLRRLKGYTLWAVRAAYPLTGQVELYGRVENLFDKRHQTIANYGQPGRAAYGGLRARF